MNNTKNGTRVFYKALCAVIFFIFCFIYIYFYQTDVLAAAQHIASGGKTQYSPILGTALIIIALKALQNGIQAIVRLKNIFFALTYLPSFLLLAMITDIPSRPESEISFGAWAWALPLGLIIWAAVIYVARQYQSMESGVRSEGLLSQVLGINITIMLAMMLLVCLIGNHNRLFHRQMRVENLISRQEYGEASEVAGDFGVKNQAMMVLRSYALAKQGLIADSLFRGPMTGIHSIIPSNRDYYTVIISPENMVNTYKRNIDWQLCEMLAKKDLSKFYNSLLVFYGLGKAPQASDSTSSKTANVKAQVKLNEYKDSLLSLRYQSLPIHYKEALILYNTLKSQPNKSFIKTKYLDQNLMRSFEVFQRTPVDQIERRFKGTYWLFYKL